MQDKKNFETKKDELENKALQLNNKAQNIDESRTSIKKELKIEQELGLNLNKSEQTDLHQELPADISQEVKAKIKAELYDQEGEEELQKELELAEREEQEEQEEEPEHHHKRLTKSRLLRFLMKHQFKELREATEDELPADLAELLEELDENNRLMVFRLLQKPVATEAFAYMSDEARNDLVEAFSDDEIIGAMELMSLDDVVDILEDMPASVVKRVLDKSDLSRREHLNRLLHYPESSAGSLMTPEYIRFNREMTVKDAFKAIRHQGKHAETIYMGYVVEQSKLVGVVSTRTLLLSSMNKPIADLMDEKVVSVKVTDDQEFVALEMQRYDFTAMPVVDNEGMLVGIITIDDAIDVLTEESTEDMQKMAAIVPSDAAATYFETTVFEQIKQRIPWLLVLMLSATFTGMVTTHYEAAFSTLPLLVSFMPMLMGTAGNCGNQVSTLMVRGLSLGDVTPKDFLRVLSVELRVAVIVGLILAIVNAARIYIMYDVLGAGAYQNVLTYAVVVSLALLISVILAKLVGGMLPLIVKTFKVDPAVVASPFITTIVDACSLVIYFQIAMVIFGTTM